MALDGETMFNFELVQWFGICRALEEGPHGPWCICALGKFGGRELGFGSDIELVFVYAGQDASGAPEMNERSRYFGEMVREFTHTEEQDRCHACKSASELMNTVVGIPKTW